MESNEWIETLNYIWKRNWYVAHWASIFQNLWDSPGSQYEKHFTWKVWMGALPMGNKIHKRGLGSPTYSTSKANEKTVLLLF